MAFSCDHCSNLVKEKIQVHYIKNGDDMLVDKVIVTQNRY